MAAEPIAGKPKARGPAEKPEFRAHRCQAGHYQASRYASASPSHPSPSHPSMARLPDPLHRRQTNYGRDRCGKAHRLKRLKDLPGHLESS